MAIRLLTTRRGRHRTTHLRWTIESGAGEINGEKPGWQPI